MTDANLTEGAVTTETPTGELRQDVITGKWVALATARAKRPQDYTFGEPREEKTAHYVETCPFCNLADYPQAPDTLRIPDDIDDWQVHMFPNKYPAFVPGRENKMWQEGPWQAMDAIGYHELLATRWHDQSDTAISVAELALKIEALVLRYRQLMIEPAVRYIQIIKNVGPMAGASLEHPHFQVFTLPVLPHDVADLLQGTRAYVAQHKTSPFSALLSFELKEKKRVVAETDDYVALCPFASRVPFEVWVLPKNPAPRFQDLSPGDREQVAELLQSVLKRLEKALPGVSYNYIVHSAPCDPSGFVCETSLYESFQWHIQVLPRLGTWGGLELAAGLEIVSTSPEAAAEDLRAVSV